MPGLIDRIHLAEPLSTPDPDIPIDSVTFMSTTGNLTMLPTPMGLNQPAFSGLLDDTKDATQYLIKGNHEGLAGRHANDPSNRNEQNAGNIVEAEMLLSSSMPFSLEWKREVFARAKASLAEYDRYEEKAHAPRKYLKKGSQYRGELAPELKDYTRDAPNSFLRMAIAAEQRAEKDFKEEIHNLNKVSLDELKKIGNEIEKDLNALPRGENGPAFWEILKNKELWEEYISARETLENIEDEKFKEAIRHLDELSLEEVRSRKNHMEKPGGDIQKEQRYLKNIDLLDKYIEKRELKNEGQRREVLMDILAKIRAHNYQLGFMRGEKLPIPNGKTVSKGAAEVYKKISMALEEPKLTKEAYDVLVSDIHRVIGEKKKDGWVSRGQSTVDLYQGILRDLTGFKVRPVAKAQVAILKTVNPRKRNM